MRRVLLDLPGVRIYSFPAMLYLGLLFGMIAGMYTTKRAELDPTRMLIAMLVLTVSGLFGARLTHVIFHWRLYRRAPARIWRRSEGGAALQGGLLLMAPVSVPLLDLLQLPFARSWDVMAFVVLIAVVFGRVGCLLNGCCGGRPTYGWFGLCLPDTRGVWRRRIPTQLMDAGAAALLLLVAVGLWNWQLFPGAVVLASLGAYALIRAALQARREVQAHVGPINMQQTFAGLVGLLALGAFLLGWLGTGRGM
jgi:phosphatidylglycerol:prolipoprotein diacylglycerol transferase